MNSKYLYVGLAVTAPFAATPGTIAADLTLATQAESVAYGVSDPRTGPPPAGILSEVILSSEAPSYAYTHDFSGPAFARAAADDTGKSAAIVDAGFADGEPGRDLYARATLTELVANTTGGPQEYLYSFKLDAPLLRITDFAGVGVGDPGAPNVTYSALILLNGFTIWSSTASLTGGRISHQLTETGTDLGGTPVGLGTATFGYDFNSHTDTLDLGTWADGTSFTLVSELFVSVEANGYELGGLGVIGDPSDLASGAGISGSVTFVPIPEPAAAAWVGGVLLVGGRGWRRSRG